MYNDIKSCIAVNGEFSDFFQSCRGIRQGENLSPILFSTFLNDLEHYLLTNNNVCLDIRDKELNIVVILYADDTVLFPNNEDEFKSILNTL